LERGDKGSEHNGHFRIRHSLLVSQQKDCATFGRELIQAGMKRAAALVRCSNVIRPWNRIQGVLDRLYWITTVVFSMPTTQLVETAMMGDAKQPRTHRRAIAKLPKVSERLNKRDLADVFRNIRIAHDAPTITVNRPSVRGHDKLERAARVAAEQCFPRLLLRISFDA
jgi:hypothetical protein